MKVLHVLNAVTGGSVYSTLELIAELKTQGVESYLVCEKNGTAARREEIKQMLGGKALFIPLYRANEKIRTALWKRPFLDLKLSLDTHRGHKFQAQLEEIVRQEKIDIIHTSTSINPEGAILAAKTGLPHVWHIRELVGPGKHFTFGDHQTWVRSVEQQSGMVVANSKATYDCLAPYMSNPNKLCTIPNAIHVNKFTPKVHTNEGNVVVAMVGALDSRWKNHASFIEVAAELKNVPNIEFRIYGKIPPETDPYMRELRHLKNTLGLTDLQLKFMGHLSKPEQFMQEIDLMFHPTSLESFGRVFTEAMAAAVPVIGINKGGALEMVRDGYSGFLVPEDDMAYICEKIKLLASSVELRQKFGNAGRQIVEQAFDMPVLGVRVKSLYEQLVSQKK